LGSINVELRWLCVGREAKAVLSDRGCRRFSIDQTIALYNMQRIAVRRSIAIDDRPWRAPDPDGIDDQRVALVMTD